MNRIPDIQYKYNLPDYGLYIAWWVVYNFIDHCGGIVNWGGNCGYLSLEFD